MRWDAPGAGLRPHIPLTRRPPAPSAAREVPPLPYTAEISRTQPACVLLLVDRSGSMADPWQPGAASKAAQVAETLNDLLRNIVLKCSKDDGVRGYFDVAALGYGERIAPLLGERAMCSVQDLAEAPLRLEQRLRRAGGDERTVQFPVWVEPHARGGTPMRAAFQAARRALEPWVVSHPLSHPPIVFHVTDGESTDGDPTPDAARLRELQTRDGELLLFNVHISGASSREVLFPTAVPDLPDPFAQMLFAISSALTEDQRALLHLEGYEAPEGARGFIFNGDPVALVDFLDVGTRPANLR